MNENTRILLTIVTELSLEKTLIREFNDLGALGYTITNARGKGTRGERSADWDVDSNIRIEIVCSEEIALAISDRMQEKYYANYGMIIFTSEVTVLRAGKF